MTHAGILLPFFDLQELEIGSQPCKGDGKEAMNHQTVCTSPL